MEFVGALPLAFGLGLLGFIEPCSVGSHLLFLKHLELASPSHQARQVTLFTLTRAGFMACLGILAAIVGSAFTGLQQGLWGFLGGLYIALGLFYLGGGAPWLMRRLCAVWPGVEGTSGSVGLGVLFGLNIPVCAAPLLAVLLGDAVARSAAGGSLSYGATTLFVFGLALSSPLVLAIYTRTGRRAMDAIARISARMPRWTGIVLVLLGAWSIYFAIG